MGNPIAKLITPPTYDGFEYDVSQMQIQYSSCVAKKTQIYHIGLTQRFKPLKYLGYSDLRQLGQYYTFSTVNGITRLYTSVNFLHTANIYRMNELLKVQRDSLHSNAVKRESKRPSEAELVNIKHNGESK